MHLMGYELIAIMCIVPQKIMGMGGSGSHWQ